MNFRTHRKLLVIDGQTGYIGGTGIADIWKGNGRTRGLWRDSHYRVEGPAVAQMQQAFMDNWLQTRTRLLHGDAYFPELKPAGEQMCQVFKSSAGEGSDSARLMLLVSIAAARRHIRIANAYFIPDRLCMRTLIEALQRGVKVEIITPGTDMDAQLVRAVGKTRWRPLLEAGARFYEYQPARFHCKYLLVDDVWASVGSANLDNRSLSLNEEANLNVLDRDFVAAHTRVFEEDKSHSREITLQDWRRSPVAGENQGSPRFGDAIADVITPCPGEHERSKRRDLTRRDLQRARLRRHGTGALGSADRRGDCQHVRRRRRPARVGHGPEAIGRRGSGGIDREATRVESSF